MPSPSATGRSSVFDAIIEPERIVLIAIFLLIGFPVHEFAHAASAYLLGDATAKHFGRLTLNPAAHFDPLGGLMLVLSVLLGGFVIGWAKPTPVNPANLRDRRNGEVVVALAGPASNLVMAALGAVAVRFLVGFDVAVPGAVGTILILFVFYNVALTVFNLIPVPPLDGSTLLFRVLDPRTAWQLRPILGQYGFVIILVFVFTAGRPIANLIFDVTRLLVGF
jgi:Zn-dependent protease